MLALIAQLLACGDDPSGPAGSANGLVGEFALAPNENNVLSAIATYRADRADSARVVYSWGDGELRATPYTQTDAGSRFVVLGLRPSTTYQMQVEAWSGRVLGRSRVQTFTTGQLPPFLQGAALTSSHPSSGGYVVTGVGDLSTAFAVAFDSTGAVAWYRAFKEGVPTGEIKQQPNGDFTIFLGATHGGEPVLGKYVEVHPDGSIVRTFQTEPAAFTDNHELVILMRDGVYDGAVFFSSTQRHLNLSAQGGPTDSAVTGHQLVRVRADGSLTKLFDAWDHFAVSDDVEPVGGEPDFDHPNALSVAADGNYLVSWRSFDAITKIDAVTGAILWTLAAPTSKFHSDFTIVGDPLHGFNAQHSVKALDSGHILLFDNGTEHIPAISRAVEYALDTVAHTATLVWEFRHTPPILTPFTGSAQRLVNGNTLIGWTNNVPLLTTEVAPDGTVVWEGRLDTPGTYPPYRFTKIAALESYRRP